jgi:hypothetical protein
VSLSSLRSPNDDLSEGEASFLCALDAQVGRGFQFCDLGFCWTFNHCGNDGHTGDLHAAIGTREFTLQSAHLGETSKRARISLS